MRSIICICLAISLMLGIASALICVRLPEGVELTDDNGTTLIGCGIYEDIIVLEAGNGELFAVCKNGLYALTDANGNILTDFVYESVYTEAGMIVAKRNGKYGILNTDGNETTEFEFDRILPKDTKGAWALRSEREDIGFRLCNMDAVGAISETGINVRRIGNNTSNGTVAVQPEDTEMWNLCLADGTLFKGAEWDYVGDFKCGITAVTTKGLSGAVDCDGNEIIPCRYLSVEISDDGLIVCKDENNVFAFAGNGDKIIEIANAGETSVACAGKHIIVYHETGTDIFDTDGRKEYSYSGDVSVLPGIEENLIIAEDVWGTKSVHIIGNDVSYADIRPMGGKDSTQYYAVCDVVTKTYLSDLLGESQVLPEMDTIRYGIADLEGKLLTEIKYASIEPLGKERFIVCEEDEYHLIDAHGNIIRTFDR